LPSPVIAPPVQLPPVVTARPVPPGGAGFAAAVPWPVIATPTSGPIRPVLIPPQPSWGDNATPDSPGPSSSSPGLVRSFFGPRDDSEDDFGSSDDGTGGRAQDPCKDSAHPPRPDLLFGDWNPDHPGNWFRDDPWFCDRTGLYKVAQFVEIPVDLVVGLVKASYGIPYQVGKGIVWAGEKVWDGVTSIFDWF
jgi:hypothetical protein